MISDINADHVQRIQRQQLLLRLLIAAVIAMLVNIAAICCLSLAIEARPETLVAKRIHQIELDKPLPPPTPQEREKEVVKQENIEKVLPSIAPSTRLNAQHEFSLPAQVVEVPNAQWTNHMNLAAIEIGAYVPQIDQHARLKFLPNLERFYPREAKRKRISGETTLELVVGSNGRVSQFKILSSIPEGVFEKSVPQLIPQIRYQPAVSNGENVSETRKIKLKWTLQ